MCNNLGKLAPWMKSEVTSSGVVFDLDLSIKSRVNNVFNTAFFHLRNITKVKPFLNQRDSENLIRAFVSGRLDHWWSPSGIHWSPQKQSWEPSAPSELRRSKREKINPVFASLHQFPVTFQTDIKIHLLVYEAPDGHEPK